MASQMCPRTHDTWGDLSPKERTWANWKATYTQAYNKALIRKKSTIGTPQFDSADLTLTVHSSKQAHVTRHTSNATQNRCAIPVPKRAMHTYALI